MYAFHADGNLVYGWPATLQGVRTATFPYVGDGVPNAPVILDVDGAHTLRIAGAPVGGFISLVTPEGNVTIAMSPGQFSPNSPSLEDGGLTLIANPSVGDMDHDGITDLFTSMGSTGLAEILTDRKSVV